MVCLREGAVSLPDGRRLGFAEYGVRGGTPVLHFHGRPGGRMDGLDPEALRAAGVWLFTLERPGTGLSDGQPGRRLMDWPNDVAAFADTMGLEKFPIVGTSAGARYALACASALMDRVRSVVLVCASLHDIGPPFDGLDQSAIDDIEALATDPTTFLRRVQAELEVRHELWGTAPEHFWSLFLEVWGEEARPVFEQDREFWLRVLASTYGGDVETDEVAIMFSPLPFSLATVSVPVAAWHGDADVVAPIGFVQRAMNELPDGMLTICSGSGHYLDNRWHPAYLNWILGH